MLYAIGGNMMKYHRFLHHEIEKYEGEKGAENRLADRAPGQQNRLNISHEQGGFASWNRIKKKEETVP